VRRLLAGVLLACLLGGPVAACSKDAPASAPAPQSSPTASATAPPVRTHVRYGVVTGRLPHAARQLLSDRIRRVVDGWTAAAYLDGPYPRRQFGRAFPGFTLGARQEAHHDRRLMSNQDIGRRIDGVVARRRGIVIDVLAVRKHAVGVTARVYLRFRTTGHLRRDVRVQGRLYLTPSPDGWKVFGYDMSKGAV
jgi:hypothetical protein